MAQRGSEGSGGLAGVETSQVGGKGSAGLRGRLPDGSSAAGNARNADRVLPRSNQQGASKLTYTIMDALQEHDLRMKIPTDLEGSRERLEKLLKAKVKLSKKNKEPELLGPIASAMRNNPGLTLEEAVEMMEAFGG